MKRNATVCPPGKIPYRQDINGMRAWAVIAVLLFHFKIPGVSAGFVGVDVFFVISGFLMTAIVLNGLEGNNFSIWQFYMARIRRIVPALMVLVVVLLILGWFWLPTQDYQALGSESAYALGFLSNIYFWRKAGYFDVAAQEKWLQHTWSLGIEFQFYILFPVFVIILWKIKPQIKTLFWGLGLVFLASLALSIVASYLHRVAAFYLLPTRGWELAAGGLAFLIGRELPSLKRFSKSIFWFGFVLWLIAIFLIDATFSWPSGWALLPVLGTVLIILAPQANSKLMLHPLAQWFGDRSYSLYLWHWPLVVALYFSGLNNEWLWVAGAFMLSLVLGNVSYWTVEKSASTYLIASGFGKQIAVLVTTGFVIGIAAIGIRSFDFKGRLPSEIDIAVTEATNKDPRIKECFESARGEGSPGCIYGDAAVGAVLVGDSHANATINSMSNAAGKYNSSVILLAIKSCPTIKGLNVARDSTCYDFNNWVLNTKLPQVEFEGIPVVLLSRTSVYVNWLNERENPLPIAYFDKPFMELVNDKYLDEFKKSLIETACQIQLRSQVYMVRPIPEMGIDVTKKLARNIMFGRGDRDIKITVDEYHKRNKLVWGAQDLAAKQCGVRILNPLPYLCDDEYCYGSRDGRPLYYDDNHLSEHGNSFLVPMFEQVFLDKK